MNSREAQFRLSVYRREGMDSRDPYFVEAVDQAAVTPALARWWAEQQALDALLAAKLRALSTPGTLPPPSRQT